MKKHFSVIVIFVAFCIFCSGILEAKVRETIRANKNDLWSATVRLIRVDKDWELIDKDKETGFIIFNFRSDSGKQSRASIEIIRDGTSKKASRESYVVQVSIPAASSIEEHMILTNLKHKLRKEY